MNAKKRGILIGLAATTVLVSVIVGVLSTLTPAPEQHQSSEPVKAALPFLPTEHTRTDTLSPQDLKESDGKIFGVFSPNTPYNTAEYNSYVTAAGTAPNALNVFTKWDSPFRADAADKAYARGAIPVVSWESWAKGSSSHDPNFTLSSIVNGAYDPYVRTFAEDVAAYGKPVIIRFNHEMNGNWYPWGAEVNGNTSAQYQAAWRHVHDIFAEAGATNSSWVWSVNVVRAVPDWRVPLAGLYPGDGYVDYVGITGYSVGEPTASALFQPTTDVIRKFTKKPIILSEIGAVPYAGKAAFITSLFAYVTERPDVTGFIWFQTMRSTGATGDYVFNDTAENTAAYAAGAAAMPLIPVLNAVVEEVAYGDKPTVTPYTVTAPK